MAAMSGFATLSRGTIRDRRSGRRVRNEPGSPKPRWDLPRAAPLHYLRRGSLQAQGAEGDPVGYAMELILMSTAVTSTLFLLQFMDFVRREHATELASRIRAIPRLLANNDTLTATAPVVAAYGR